MTEDDTFNKLKRKPLNVLEHDWDCIDGVYEEWAAKCSGRLPWTSYLKHNGWTIDEYHKWLDTKMLK